MLTTRGNVFAACVECVDLKDMAFQQAVCELANGKWMGEGLQP
jgi:hypothetical protein